MNNRLAAAILSTVRTLGLLTLLLLCLLPSAFSQERTHVVRQGDTLAKLMWLYGVSGDSILQANHLSSSTLRPGTKLVIPGAATREPARAEPAGVPRATAVPPTPVAVAAEPPPAASSTETPLPDANPRNTNDFSAAIAVPAAQNIRYNGRWVPPGETSAWVMDCSNTSRWLYRTVRGIDIPRTASDQYEWLRKRHRLWRIGPNERALRKNLRPGDLLFWEHTYRPPRRPPVTHVMVYLGTDERGRLMMAGSQGASGPDIYEFQPSKKMGGYRFFFFFRRDGRFVAFGRP